MCRYQGQQQMLCDQLQAYTDSCLSAGAPVHQWREPDFCRESSSLISHSWKYRKVFLYLFKTLYGHNCVLFFQFSPALVCPPNSHYSICVSSCPETCLGINGPPGCSEKCVEGCECNAGFILSDDKCVPLKDCGCVDSSGSYHPVSFITMIAPLNIHIISFVLLLDNMFFNVFDHISHI